MNKLLRAQEEEYTRQILKLFFETYPDEESCVRAFPANCKCCGTYNEQAYENGERFFECSMCNTKTWRTAGTFFHGLHYLHPSFASIWLHEMRAVISDKKLGELFDIAYATAWATAERVMSLLDQEMKKHNAFKIVSSAFNDVICKRSDLCVAGEHPNFEEADDDDFDPEVLKNLDPDQAALYAVLRAKPMSFDTLLEQSGLPVSRFTAALSSLELFEIATQHPNSKFSLRISTTTLMTPAEEVIVQKFLKYVRNFHGVSRKHLQNYLAAFWARYWSARWPLANLFEVCMKSGRLKRSNRYKKPPKIVRVPTF